jgi:hypothetical protein
MAGYPTIDDELTCATCVLSAPAPAIRAIWIAADRIYWTEYGSLDELDNHQNDGRLMSMALDGGEPVVVADELEAPTWLAVGDMFAYLWLQHSRSPQGELQLARVSLDSGDVELLQAYPGSLGGTGSGKDWARRHFVYSSGYAHWWVPNDGGLLQYDGTLYQLAEGSQEPPEKVADIDGFLRLMADASSLYIHDLEGIQALPLAGGEVKAIFKSADSDLYDTLVIAGGAFYGNEASVPKSHVVQLPLLGGTFERLAKSSSYHSRMVVGDDVRFVGSTARQLSADVYGAALVDGVLTDPDSARTLATLPPWFEHQRPRERYKSVRAWDVTADAVFLGYEDSLYRIARQP